jgi:hypothetical protein
MLLKESLRQLVTTYDPEIERVITEVLELEQQNISQARPRLKDPIDEIITNVVEKKSVKIYRQHSLEQ